jgi:hypothetical protein
MRKYDLSKVKLPMIPAQFLVTIKVNNKPTTAFSDENGNYTY